MASAKRNLHDQWMPEAKQAKSETYPPASSAKPEISSQGVVLNPSDCDLGIKLSFLLAQLRCWLVKNAYSGLDFLYLHSMFSVLSRILMSMHSVVNMTLGST